MKTLIKWIGILIAVVAVVLGGAWFFAPQIVAHAISSDFGTKATVENFRVGLETTTFGGITIMSPPGSRVAQALSVKSGEARAPLIGAVTADPYVIDRVYMKDIDLSFDFPMGPSLKSGNWGRMLMYSDAHGGASSRETVIRELILENVSVTMIGIDGKKTQLKPIDRLRLTNVSTRTGVQKSQLAGVVFGQIVSQVLSFENLLPALEKAAMQGLGEAASGAQAVVSDAASGLQKGLGGLFGGSAGTEATPKP